MGLLTQRKGGPVSVGGFRRRDADGGGRDDRAPKKVAHEWGGNILAIPAIPGAFDGIDPRKSLQIREEGVGFWPPGQRMWNYPR